MHGENLKLNWQAMYLPNLKTYLHQTLQIPFLIDLPLILETKIVCSQTGLLQTNRCHTRSGRSAL